MTGWQIAKAYGDRVFHDVETGQKTWEDLPVSIMADTFLHAKDTVAMKAKKTQLGEVDPKKKKKKAEGVKGKVCTTYNTFRTGDVHTSSITVRVSVFMDTSVKSVLKRLARRRHIKH